MSSPLDELSDVFARAEALREAAQPEKQQQKPHQQHHYASAAESSPGDEAALFGPFRASIGHSSVTKFTSSEAAAAIPAVHAASTLEDTDAFGDWESASGARHQPELQKPHQQAKHQHKQQNIEGLRSSDGGCPRFDEGNALQWEGSGSFAELVQHGNSSSSRSISKGSTSSRYKGPPISLDADMLANLADAAAALGADRGGCAAATANVPTAAAGAAATAPVAVAHALQKIAQEVCAAPRSHSSATTPLSAAESAQMIPAAGDSTTVRTANAPGEPSGLQRVASVTSLDLDPRILHTPGLHSEQIAAPEGHLPGSGPHDPSACNATPVCRSPDEVAAASAVDPDAPSAHAAAGVSSKTSPGTQTDANLTEMTLKTGPLNASAAAARATPQQAKEVPTATTGCVIEPISPSPRASSTTTAAKPETATADSTTPATIDTAAGAPNATTATESSHFGAVHDWEAVERLSQKYRQLKKQNALLKEALRQQQKQQQQQQLEHQQQGQGQRQQQHQQQHQQQQQQQEPQQEEPQGLVSQLQQQVALGEFRQRQLLDELDTAQRELKRQQQQLQQQQQQLQQQHLLLLKTGAANSTAGGAPGSSWGLSLLGGGSAAAKDAELKALQQQVEVLREELQLKIEENERLHLEAFEERQQQQQQQQQLEATISLLQKQHEEAQQQQQQHAADYAELQRHYERLNQRQEEKLRQQQQQLEHARGQEQLLLQQTMEDRQQLMFREQQQQQKQEQIVAYYSTLLGCDYTRLPLLRCLDLPSGGYATAAAAAAAAREELLRLIVAALGDLQHVLQCWAAGLEVSTVAGAEQGSEGLSEDGLDSSDAETPANRLPLSLGLAWRIRIATRQARRAAIDSVASIATVSSLLERAVAAAAVSAAETLARRVRSGSDVFTEELHKETEKLNADFSRFVSLTLLAVSLQHDALSGPQQQQRQKRQQLDAMQGNDNGSIADPFGALLEELQRGAAALAAVFNAASAFMEARSSSDRSGSDDYVAADTRVLSKQHFAELAAALEDPQDKQDEEMPTVPEKRQQKLQEAQLQHQLQEDLGLPPLPALQSASVRLVLQQQRQRQHGYSNSPFPWRSCLPLPPSQQRMDEEELPLSECNKWMQQLRSCRRAAAAAGLTLSGWRGTAKATKERLLQLLVENLDALLQTFRSLAVCLSGRVRRPADLVDGQLLLLSGTGPCTLSLLQALRAVSSADGGLYRLLQHSKLLLQMQRCPSYAVLRSEAVEEVAVVGLRCVSQARAALLSSSEKISARDARQVISKRQAAEAEVAAAAAEVRLLEERMAEANKGAAQLRVAQTAVALLQAELVRLKRHACSTAGGITTDAPPTRSSSSRYSAQVDGGAVLLPMPAVPACPAGESVSFTASKGSSAAGDATAEGAAFSAGNITANSANVLARGTPLTCIGLHFPAEERDGVYAQQLLLLQQKLHTEAAALSILKMQLSSAFKAVHALEDQRAALRYELRRSKEEAAAAAAAAVAAATETAASARLAEENYSQQLRLLSLHVAETHEKNKETQRELEDLLKHKILCGRCGVWNPLSDLLVEGQSWGSCVMCTGRVMERPF